MTTLGMPTPLKKDGGAKKKRKKRAKKGTGGNCDGGTAEGTSSLVGTYATPRNCHDAGAGLAAGVTPGAKGASRRKKPPRRQQKTKGGSTADYRSSDDEYYDDDFDEGRAGYRLGGYHPVRYGEMYNRRYRVVQKLGWGHFSTVWLAVDQYVSAAELCRGSSAGFRSVHVQQLHLTDSYVALKIVKSAPRYTEAAEDEIELLSVANGKMKRKSKAAPLEGEVLRAALQGKDNVARLLDHFRHKGPNGKHVVMVFEVLGDNFLSVLEARAYAGLPLPMVKSIVKQLLQGVQYLHEVCNIIHTDLKLENVMIVDPHRRAGVTVLPHHLPRNAHLSSSVAAAPQRSSSNGDEEAGGENGDESEGGGAEDCTNAEGSDDTAQRVETDGVQLDRNGDSLDLRRSAVLSGREGEDGEMRRRSHLRGPAEEGGVEEFCNITIADLGNACWVDHHFTSDVQTRQYRAPEVIVRAPYGPAIDVWSVGCIVFELLTGDLLFKPKDGSDFEKEDDHLALMMELLGEKFPRRLLVEGSNSRKYFDRGGRLRAIKTLRPWLLADVLEEKYHFPRDTADEIASFMLPMLEMNPHKRVTARRALEHAWLGDADGTTPLCTVASSKIWREERIRRKRMEEEAKRTLEEKRREEQSGEEQEDDAEDPAAGPGHSGAGCSERANGACAEAQTGEPVDDVSDVTASSEQNGEHSAAGAKNPNLSESVVAGECRTDTVEEAGEKTDCDVVRAVENGGHVNGHRRGPAAVVEVEQSTDRGIGLQQRRSRCG